MLPDTTIALTSPRTTAFMVPMTVPLMVPRIAPLITTVPVSSLVFTGRSISKVVFSISLSPTNRICGRTNITRKTEIMVPRPRHSPIPAMQASEVICPMNTPARIIMEPEVMIVGNEKFSASMMELLRFCLFLQSMYLLEMTMA